MADRTRYFHLTPAVVSIAMILIVLVPHTATETSNIPRQHLTTGIPYYILQDGADYNNSDPVYIRRTHNRSECFFRAADPYMHNKIKDLVNLNLKLINYNLTFANHTKNPLTFDMRWAYHPTTWARASSIHGQTLLSLAFNYGILSLMTLTFGVEYMDIQLVDEPHGCVWNMTELQKIDEVMYLLMRDFGQIEEITLIEDERICHEIVINDNGFAKFTDRCCMVDRITGKEVCKMDLQNIWLAILIFLLATVKYTIMLFGPLLFIPAIESIAKDTIPYRIDLKDPLKKIVCFAKSSTQSTKFLTPKTIIDLRKVVGFAKFKKATDDLPLGTPLRMKVDQYNINVNYHRLMVESHVPVGVVRCLVKTFCGCKIMEISPFKECCKQNLYRSLPTEKIVNWSTLCHNISRLLVVLLLPTPYYLRLVIFYLFENEAIQERKHITAELSLKEKFESSLIYYFTPTHPIFITMYILYFLTACVLAYVASRSPNGRFRRVIIGSFRDLKQISWIGGLAMLASNAAWPFHRFGVLGCLVGLVYWPIVMPISFILYLFYCLPSIYIIFRMLFYSRETVMNVIRPKSNGGKYRIRKKVDTGVTTFEKMLLLDKISPNTKQKEEGGYIEIVPPNVRVRRFMENLMSSILLVAWILSVLLLMTECAGFVVEMLVFTMMGVIVNAGSVLKYCTLLFMVLLYSYDTYNNVGKKYLKLNRALFSDLKGRIKNLDSITGLPSYLQENYGFKSQELSEQAEHELPDDINEDLPLTWMINDLTLFIDNDDMPRIPLKLFEDACEIRVAGAPGPVYLSLLEATKSFLMIVLFLVFVFIVVLSFGEVYQVSSTNQMLATMAGGFMPFILKNFMQPARPDVELGSLSFKSKLDEIIKNFFQNWPMRDFPLELDPPEPSEIDEAEKRLSRSVPDNINLLPQSRRPSVAPAHMRPSPLNKFHYLNTNHNSCPNMAKETDTPIANGKSQSIITETVEDDAEKKPKVRITENEEVVEKEQSRRDTIASCIVEDTKEVDYLIYVPEQYDERWLNEWSDIDEYTLQTMAEKYNTNNHNDYNISYA